MYHYQKNIGDYRSATMHLSLLEHGVYNQLLDWYYLNEQPLSLDNRTLFRRLSAKSEIEQEAVLDVLNEMFIKTADGWIHKRVEREIAQYKAKSQQAREAGKLGGRPPKNGDGSENNRDGFEKKSDAKPTANREPITDNKEEAKASSSTSSRPKIAACPHEAIIDLFGQHLPTLPQPRLELWRNSNSAKALASRWRWVLTEKKKTGERYAETTDDAIEWFGRYFVFVSESDFLMGRKGDFVCSLGWLVKASNFAKVLCGNYVNRGGE